MGYCPWGRKDLKHLGMHAVFYDTHIYGYSILYLCLYITQSPAKGHLGCSYISATRVMNRTAIILNQTYFTSWNLHITLSVWCILPTTVCLANCFLFFRSLLPSKKSSPATTCLGLSTLHSILCFWPPDNHHTLSQLCASLSIHLQAP